MPMTPEERAAALAQLDEAHAVVDAAKLAAQEVQSAINIAADTLAKAVAYLKAEGEAPPPVDPLPPVPEPVVPTPQHLAAAGVPGAVTLLWGVPEGAEDLVVFVAWGSGGYLGQANPPKGASTFTVTGLDPSKRYAFDVGYVGRDGKMGQLSRAEAQPLPTAPPSGTDAPAPADYPAGAPWQDRANFIRSRAGAGDKLQPVASAEDIAAANLPGVWRAGVWEVPACPEPFRNLDVAGLVRYAGQEPLQMENCRARGVQYVATAGKQGGRFINCTVVANPGLPLGQGGINFFGQQGWLVQGCDVSGFSDGIQAVGPGTILDSYFHGFAYGLTPNGQPTHNDGCQNYRGTIRVGRCVYEMGGKAGSTNGALFCSNRDANFEAFELFAEVTRDDVNLLHAWDSPVGITVRGGRLSRQGRLIGKVQLVNVVRD